MTPPRRSPRADALALLARRGLSRCELHDRLSRRGHAPGVIDSTLSQLAAERLVDDRTLAYNLARRYAETARYGPARVEILLRTRGIESSLAQDAVRAAYAAIDLEVVVASAADRLAATPRQGGDPQRERARRVRNLIRRGFPPEIVHRALDHAPATGTDHDRSRSNEDTDDAIP